MTYTPEQLREHAKQWDDDGRYSIGEVFRAHAAALEELNVQRIEAENYRVKYAEMRARAERAEAELADARNTTVPGSAAIYARLEQRLAESERKIERLKFHAEGMWLDLKTIAHEEKYALAKSAADYRADKDAK